MQDIRRIMAAVRSAGHLINSATSTQQKETAAVSPAQSVSYGNTTEEGNKKMEKKLRKIGTIRSKSIIPDMPEAVPTFSNIAILFNVDQLDTQYSYLLAQIQS